MVLRTVHPSQWHQWRDPARHSLELELPGELILGLLQLLALLDVLFLEVVDLSLHSLELGKELQRGETQMGKAVQRSLAPPPGLPAPPTFLSFLVLMSTSCCNEV